MRAFSPSVLRRYSGESARAAKSPRKTEKEGILLSFIYTTAFRTKRAHFFSSQESFLPRLANTTRWSGFEGRCTSRNFSFEVVESCFFMCAPEGWAFFVGGFLK